MTKVAAKELTEGDVRFISLVNRGANRDPFRIVKGEGHMIDLARIFKFGDKVKTGVAFVAVSKAVGLDSAKALVEKAGFGTENVVEQDAGILFVQEGFSEADRVVIYRATADVMVGVSVSDPEKITKGYESYNWQSTDFGEVLGTEQTIPMFHVAVSALCDTFYNALQKAESPEEARSSVNKMLADFSAHVMDVLGNVPVTAFKLETVLAEVQTVEKTEDQDAGEGAEKKPDEETTEVEKTEGEDADAEADADKDEVEKAEPEEGADADAEGDTDADADGEADPDADKDDVEKAGSKGGKGKGGKPGMDQSDASDPKKTAKKSDDADAPPAWAATLLKSVEETQATVASIASEVTGVKKTVSDLGADLSATKASIAKMDEAMGTNVVGGEAEDDDAGDGKKTAKKSDGGSSEDEGFLMIDTAFGDPFKDND